jgi:hypothetical protein
MALARRVRACKEGQGEAVVEVGRVSYWADKV